MHAAADIGDHEISFGFEYEQRKDSYWGCRGWFLVINEKSSQ